MLLSVDFDIFAQFASVGLTVSGSHNSGEITCEIAYNLSDAIYSHAIYKYMIYIFVTAEDEATSESYKGMNLVPMDGSLIVLFFAAIALFPTLLRLFLAR